jgi:hypothetical protein
VETAGLVALDEPDGLTGVEGAHIVYLPALTPGDIIPGELVHLKNEEEI